MMKRFWWLNLVRGSVALIIGVVVVVRPDAQGFSLLNYMGIYWLVSGVVSLRWGIAAHRAKGAWLVAGLVGTLGGLAILLRPVYAYAVDLKLLTTLLGIVALATGLAHLFGGFKTPEMIREQSPASFLLGLMEITLGILLILFTTVGPIFRLAAGGWALVGGTALILQALQMNRAAGRRGA